MTWQAWTSLLWCFTYLVACIMLVSWYRRLRRWHEALHRWTLALLERELQLEALRQPPDTATLDRVQGRLCTQCGTMLDEAVFWRGARYGVVLCEACYDADVQRKGGAG